MNKIRDLESRWKHYRVRKIIVFLLSLLITYLIVAIGYYLLTHWQTFFPQKESLSTPLFKLTAMEKSANIAKEVNVTTITKETVLTKEESKVEKIENPEEELEKLLFRPIIPIIEMDREKRHSSKKVVHRKSNHAGGVKAKPSTYLTAKELSSHSKAKTQSNSHERDTTKLKQIHFESSSQNYIKTMEHKFSKSKNARDALLLAKAFYREGNYHASEKWALEANKINSNLEESWILFAKSKAKLGRKHEAIEILALYYKRTKLLKVKAIIEKIKRGQI